VSLTDHLQIQRLLTDHDHLIPVFSVSPRLRGERFAVCSSDRGDVARRRQSRRFLIFPITRLLNYQICLALTAIHPRCHSDRCRSIRDGKRGTPRMFAANMQRQGILSRIHFVFLRVFVVKAFDFPISAITPSPVIPPIRSHSSQFGVDFSDFRCIRSPQISAHQRSSAVGFSRI
jgi:hypothetical protein